MEITIANIAYIYQRFMLSETKEAKQVITISAKVI